MNKLKSHLVWPFALATALVCFLNFGARHNDSSAAEPALQQGAGIAVNPQAGPSAVLQARLYGLNPLSPVDAAGLGATSIEGRVVDGSVSPPKPIPGAVVLVERRDPANASLDRVVRAVLAAQNGSFLFSSLPSGRYDVVASAAVISPLGVPTTYSPTVTLKVPLGSRLGDIPLNPEPPPVDTTAPSTPATITGEITNEAAGQTPAVADISLAALQPLGKDSSAIVTVPVFQNSLPDVETSSSPDGSCPTGTNCVNYKLLVPAGNPVVGIYSASPPTTYAPPASGDVHYWVNAQAFVPVFATSHPDTLDCSPSSLPAVFEAATQLTVKPGGDTPQDFHFTGCRQ